MAGWGARIQLVERRSLRLFHAINPEFGFEAGEALEQPVGADEGIDEEALEVGGGLPILVVAGGHGFEFGRIFARDHLGFGVDAGFQSVKTGDSFSFRGARARGQLRIAAIRLDLTLRRHRDLFPTTV